MEKFNKEMSRQDGNKGLLPNLMQAKSSQPARQEINLAALTAKIICYLLVIALAIVLIARLMRRSIISRRGEKKSGRLVQVLESAFLAPGKTVNLVRIADRVVVVGVAQNSMNFLTEFNAEQSKRVIESDQAMVQRPLPGFSDAIGRFIKDKNFFSRKEVM